MCDLRTLEKLAEKLKEDADAFSGLSPAGMRSIAGIIEAAIGAPLSWPSREAGSHAADAHYPAEPSLRLAFNWGVKWAVENYQPTIQPSNRYGAKK